MGQIFSHRRRAKRLATGRCTAHLGLSPHHVDNANYCEKCDAFFSSPREREIHEATHQRHVAPNTRHPPTPTNPGYVPHCKSCDRYFPTEEELYHHFSNDHRGNIDAAIGGKTTAPQVKPPPKDDDDVPHCSQCDRYFSSYAELQFHIETSTEHHKMVIHEPSPPPASSKKAEAFVEVTVFDCLECGRRFDTPFALSVHTSSVHFGAQPGQEAEPTAETHELPKYQDRLVSEPEEPREIVQCPRCNALFSYRSELPSHVSICKGKSRNPFETLAEPVYNNQAGPSSAPIMNGFANSGPIAFPTPTISSPSSEKMTMPEPDVPMRRPIAPTHSQSWSPTVMSPPVLLNVGSVAKEKAPAQSSTYECPLCLEFPKSASNIPCGHVFCMNCIRDFVINDARCPICRNPANLSDLRRVFL